MLAENEHSFYAPPVQVPAAPPPESFDQELNELDLGDWLFRVEQLDFEGIFSALPLGDTHPDTTLGSFMYPTDSGHEIAPSQYSSSNEFMSDYSINAPSSQVTQEDYITPDFNGPVIFSEPPQLTGSFPSTPTNIAISDPSAFFFRVSDSADELSHALNQSPNPDLSASANDPVYVTPDELTHSAPARTDPKGKVFQCPHCPLSSARKHNLKTHIATHKKLKPFMCNICKRRFGRKHDVRRHIEVRHEDQRSWLSTHLDTLIISVPTNGAPADDMVAQMPGAG